MDGIHNLDETETYAAAALFTLALYSSQVEVGVDRFQANADGEYRASAWGCPPELDLYEVLLGEAELQSKDLMHFWGWDCCGPKGLCSSIYRRLNIPQKSWTGLMKIPETVGDVSTDAGVDDLIHVVERYSRMLDPELCYSKGQAVELFSVQRQRSIDMGELDMVAAGCVPEDEDGMDGTAAPKYEKRSNSLKEKLPDITEDSRSDEGSEELALLESNASAKEKEPEPVAATGWEGALTQNGETVNTVMPLVKPSAFAVARMENSTPPQELDQQLSDSDSDGDAAYKQYMESLKQPEEIPVVEETEDVVIPKAGFKPRSDYEHHASGKSCLALRALVRSALLEDALLPSENEEKKEENNVNVCIQWYDARCRIALMRIAHWLRIPWSTMVAFEIEAALSELKLKDGESVTKKSTAVSRWLKISAMAIGGGAAVAFTGGLAAPAVAAGLGAAVTLAGGGAAAASAVTGFAASTAGTATITTAFGAFGAHSTGSTMYKRTNDVKEFAFWDLSMDWTAEIEKKKQKAQSSSATSRFWPWKKSNSDGKGERSRSMSMSQLPDDNIQDSAAEKEGYLPLTDTPSEPDSPDSPDAENLDQVQNVKRKVEVVPGVEVDLDDLEVTKPTSNYTDWWESLLRAKERPDLLPLPVNSSGDNSHLALTIAVSGVISNDKHFIDPWRKLPSLSCDRFAIVWESKLLKKVSDALVGLITSQVANEAAKWFIKKYLYTGLLSAVAIPVLITTLVDVTVGNNWALAMDRSLKAGELLAQYLLQGLHGNRPVTLIGYSLGARCIFRCLLTLYQAGKRGIVENVILLGAPVSLTDYKWVRARSVVAGRFVNGYSTGDWVLGVIFRVGRGVLQSVAGISPVEVPGVENVDLSAIVTAQTEYAHCMKDILSALNL